MKVYTYSEARKKFSHLFSDALKEGIIHIKSKEGLLFTLTPGKESPLDVPSVDLKLSREEIIDSIHESRER
jgi:hypothetical protein